MWTNLISEDIKLLPVWNEVMKVVCWLLCTVLCANHIWFCSLKFWKY